MDLRSHPPTAPDLRAQAGPTSLLERAKDGEEEAFEAVIRPLIGPGYRLAYAMLGDAQGAEDAVQEACLKAWRKIRRVHPEADPGPWFLGIVANECRTLWRSKWRLRVRLLPLEPADRREPATSSSPVLEAMRHLSSDDRAVLTLRYLLDMSIDQTSTALGLSPEVVRSRTHRASRRLRERLKLEANDDGR